jgi:glycosyltransferase involved in cell wall biosynthesis
MAETIRVLQIVGVMDPGGMENFIMNLYEKMDKDKIQFDFVVHMRRDNDYVELIRQMGGKVYELPQLTKHPLRNLKAIYHIVKANNYPIVIRHASNALIAPQLLVAKMGGAYTICHSHNETDPNKFLQKLGRVLMQLSVNDRFACSEKAGKWMFGNKPYKVIHNAIDIDKFEYSPDKAKTIIEEFKLQGKHIYGNIANFRESKNHLFLMEIYKEILKIDSEAIFFCLGEGNLRSMVEEKIKSLGLEDKVILTGVRFDVENFMSCFDVLIFPSLFEGLPLTLIEAQASGLPCLISDTITKDVVVTNGLINYESINKSANIWAQRAVELREFADNKSLNRTCQRNEIAKAGYDCDVLAKWYGDYLIDKGVH